ncbi:MAG: glycine cleavage system aminomethyltransferase GcvT [Candidatus Margulisbacteria bacterium]|nr:glycine cleavage system aminomethyltransferase GcvT [Candidatus Margulisiibacteriota bacterium]
MLKRTVLFDNHLSLGAKMVPFGGWEMPVSYSGIINEHKTVREKAGLFDIGHMGLLKLSGAGTLPFLQSLTTNDPSLLAVGQCQYSVLCNEHGGAVDDILLYRFSEHYLIICNASNTDKVVSWLAGHQPKNVALARLKDLSALSLQGPLALPLAEKGIGTSLSSLKRNHTLLAGPLVVSRTGYTGEEGVELILPKELCPDYWEKLLSLGFFPCGLGARDTLRLESGLPLYGHEYDEATTPVEAGYAWAVKINKGPFIGRDALLKEKEEGPKKTLVGLELSGRAIPRQGALVYPSSSNTPVGQVTSGTFSPTFSRPIALAYVAPSSFSSGDKAFVDIRGVKHPATIVDKTFYKRVK